MDPSCQSIIRRQRKVFSTPSEHQHKLQQDPYANGYCFPQPPMLAFKYIWGSNLNDFLVQTKLDTGCPQIACTFPCSRPRCLTCAHTSRRDRVHGHIGTWRIFASHTYFEYIYILYILCPGLSLCLLLYTVLIGIPRHFACLHSRLIIAHIVTFNHFNASAGH